MATRTAAAGPTQLLARDGALAVLVSLLELSGLRGQIADLPLTDDPVVLGKPGVAGVLLLLLGTLSLTLRRIAPMPVLVLNGLVLVAYQGLGYRPPPLPLGLLVILFTVAAVRRPLIAAGATATVLMIIAVNALTGFGPLTDDQFYVYMISSVAGLMVGYGVQLGQAGMILADERTSQLVREQESRTRAAVEEERARIARELHDLVAHDVSVIVALAASALRVVDRNPDFASHALTSIEAVGRDALQGMRRLVGLLRTDSGLADRSPQPGLDRLPWLLDQVSRAGLSVDFTVSGEPRPLPATIELNAFRIVQEALTNILKHAGATRAAVTLAYAATSFRLEVQDSGPGQPDLAVGGYGLQGMRQRVAMLGGEMSAGPSVGGGFRVTACLPVASVPG